MFDTLTEQAQQQARAAKGVRKGTLADLFAIANAGGSRIVVEREAS